jgi:hypothetical protein
MFATGINFRAEKSIALAVTAYATQSKEMCTVACTENTALSLITRVSGAYFPEESLHTAGSVSIAKGNMYSLGMTKRYVHAVLPSVSAH